MQLYKENTIAKCFFSNGTQKQAQIQDKNFEKANNREIISNYCTKNLPNFQNTIAKQYLVQIVQMYSFNAKEISKGANVG